MLKQFIAHVQQQHLFPTGQQVLLAVSGGVDSVVLAHLMHCAGFPFAIAHCNFHIRPIDCDRDEQFVRSLAQKYNVPIHVAQFDTLAYSSQHHLCVEDAARKLRYAFFDTIARDQGYAAVLTAHHRDDSNETFFINLLRGTGLSGLHGILPVNGNLVRPLLPFSRIDIEKYASANGLSHVEDTTNASFEYRRNQIRHLLLPLLRQIQPSSDFSIHQTIQNLQGVENLYQALLSPLRSQYVSQSDDGTVRISLRFPTNMPSKQLLFELLRPFGYNISDVADILSSDQPGRQFYSSTHVAILDRHALLLRPLDSLNNHAQLSFSINLESISDFPSYSDLLFHLKSLSSDQAVFDADKVSLPLTLRHWINGDRFQPLGMAKGTQLVSDYFSDHKFDFFSKHNQYLLVDSKGLILWIVGHRTSHAARVTPSTSCLLRVSVFDSNS